MIKYNHIGDLSLWQTEKRGLQTKTNDRRTALDKEENEGITKKWLWRLYVL